MIKHLILFSVLAIFSISAHAQKLKYKDVWAVIQAEKWEEAEPLLNTFLAQPKNNDEPHAHYSIAKIYERKAMSAGIPQDTTAVFQNIDTATAHFSRSLQLITEKELKRNDQYYQEFNRRDLRTGDFVIKISDIHLEIENKIKALEERRIKIRTFLKQASQAETLYRELSARLAEVKATHKTQALYLLSLDKKGEEALRQFELTATEWENALEVAMLATEGINGASYQIVKKPLADLAEFEILHPDFAEQGTVTVPDLRAWAEKSRSTLLSEVTPFQQELMAYDRELEAKKQQFDEGGEVDNIPPQPNATLMAKLMKYKKNSLEQELIQYKVEELNFLAETRPKAFPDSSLVGAMYAHHEALMGRLQKMAALIDVSPQEISSAFSHNPLFFEGRYVSADALTRYVADRASFTASETPPRATATEYWKERKRWLITAAKDSILLAEPDALVIKGQYGTLHVYDSAGLYALGIKKKGKAFSMFIAKSSPTYTTEWVQEVVLPTPDNALVFGRQHAYHAPAAEGYRTFYLHFPLNGKTHLVIATVDAAGTIPWKVSLALDQPPVSVTFNEILMETIIHLAKPQDTTNLGYVVIDRNGKVRQ